MSFIEVAQADLSQHLDKGEFFVFNKKPLKALAFLHGIKNDYVEKLKDLMRIHGFEYDYDYGCYIKCDKDKCDVTLYREAKDEFIDQIINWKIAHNQQV